MIVGWPAAATRWNTVSTKPGLALVPNLALKTWMQRGPHCRVAAPAGSVPTVLRPMWSRRAGRSGSCPSRSFGGCDPRPARRVAWRRHRQRASMKVRTASTAVVVVGLRQAQLGEDAAHVLLDGALGHLKAVGRRPPGNRNCLHWVRDVTYQEDKSLVRTGNAPRAMASQVFWPSACRAWTATPTSPLPTDTTPAIRNGR
jgi:hypothetical protein